MHVCVTKHFEACGCLSHERIFQQARISSARFNIFSRQKEAQGCRLHKSSRSFHKAWAGGDCQAEADPCTNASLNANAWQTSCQLFSPCFRHENAYRTEASMLSFYATLNSPCFCVLAFAWFLNGSLVVAIVRGIHIGSGA